MALPLNVDATWLNAIASYDAGELRRADTAAFGGVGSALGIGGGVVRHGDTSLAVTVDGADVVTIQPGSVAIPGNAVAGTGCYRAAVETAVTGSLTARNVTNPRIDLVVFRAMDTDVVPAHAAYTGRVEIIAGTPSATPGVPTFPTMAVELARITVPQTGGGTATVDSSFRTYACAIGGEMVVPTFARLPASAAKWQKALALDSGARYEWSGSAWVAPPGHFAGTETVRVGTVPPIGTRKITKQASVVLTTSAGGGATITFPVAFPNALASYLVFPGDLANSLGIVRGFATGDSLTKVDLSTFTAGGVALASGLSIRLNYIAIGW